MLSWQNLAMRKANTIFRGKVPEDRLKKTYALVHKPDGALGTPSILCWHRGGSRKGFFSGPLQAKPLLSADEWTQVYGAY